MQLPSNVRLAIGKASAVLCGITNGTSRPRRPRRRWTDVEKMNVTEWYNNDLHTLSEQAKDRA